MQKAFALIVVFIAVAAFPLVAGAAGVKLTKDQVATVCGKGLRSSGSISGCKKTCGTNKEHTCEYGCENGKNCEGTCTDCGVKTRTVVFPNLYSKRMVRQSLRSSP
jgi:hypothetical protein